METEAKAAAKVDHPQICRVYDFGEIDGIRFIALQYIEGEDLKSYLGRVDRKREPAEAISLVLQIARALEAAHAKDVIHRDLKPANIMLNQKGEPVIMDFGLARRLSGATNAGLTQGMILGTAAYMSPEQAVGKSEGIDHRSDLYSLGVMLFELLTGDWPFTGSAIEVIGKKSVQEAPSPLSLDASIPPQLAAICQKMIARKKEDRYANCAEVIAALEAVDLKAPGALQMKGEPPEATSAFADQERPAFTFLDRTSAAVPSIFSTPTRKKAPLAPVHWLLGCVGVCGVLLAVVLFSRPGDAIVKVEVQAEGVEVTFQKEKLKLADGTKQFKVRPGDQILHIKSGDVEYDTDKFTLIRGDNPAVTVELVNSVIVTKLGKIEINRKPLAVSSTNQPVNTAQDDRSERNDYRNTLNMEFVRIPKGKSWLGGSAGKFGDQDVEFADDFYLGKYEVTQDEWENVMGNHVSHFSRNGPGKDAVKGVSDADLKRFPVGLVSGKDCQEFATRLNQRLKEVGWIYRLPTESEWEYACRGGPMTDRFESAFDFYFDRPMNQLLPEDARFGMGHSGFPNRVDANRPNRLGLYGMHDNMHEWCQGNARPVVNGEGILLRGGSYFSPPSYCRAITRFVQPEARTQFNVGFRVARVRVGETAGLLTPRADFSSSTSEIDLKRFRILGGQWRVEGNELLQTDVSRGFKHVFFGDPTWTDYDVSADFMRVTEGGSIAILFRATELGFYLFDIGLADAFVQEIHVEKDAKGKHVWWDAVPRKPRPGIKSRVWYTARVRVRGDHIQCFLSDGMTENKIFDFTDRRYLNGSVGLRCGSAVYRFRNINVTTPADEVLWNPLPLATSK